MSRTADAQVGDDRFDASGRQLLEQAGSEARRLGHEYVGTDHLVLALTSRTEGIAVAVLREQQVDLAQVRGTIESMVRPGRAAPAPHDTLASTTRTETVFALAQESAVERGGAQVSAEDLLIAIVREAKGLGAQVLVHHGVSLDVLIDSIKRMDSRTPVP